MGSSVFVCGLRETSAGVVAGIWSWNVNSSGGRHHGVFVKEADGTA